MMKTGFAHNKETQSIYGIALFVSICTALYLGYMDEGYNNFNFLRDPGNWLAIGLYTALIWALYCGIIYMLDVALRFTRKHRH
jgi:hypothetical protein